MKTRKHSVHCVVGLFAVALAMTLFLTPSAQMQKDTVKSSMQTKGGLNVVTFDTTNGKVIVNLPDDMMAGDTISGTVVAEPKGNSDEERAKSEAVLNGYVVEVKSPKQAGHPSEVRVPAARGTRLTVFLSQGDGSLNKQNVLEVNLLGIQAHGTTGPAYVPPDIANPGRHIIAAGTRIDISNPGKWIIAAGPRPDIANPGTRQIIAAGNAFDSPTIGQQGRSMEITGPFDGNSENTSLNWTRARSTVQDFEKNTENVSGGFGLIDGQPIAESPRKAVFRVPTNVTGPIELHLKEGNASTWEHQYRVVGVNLTAPKTSLLKGESTTLKIEVSGLQGIKEPVPLHLTKGGVVTMQGGDSQTMSIKPSDVQTNGTFTTTRMITGVQAGVWNATATVVVFDVCLQDENNGNSIILNRETGDYIFCQGFSNSQTIQTQIAADAVKSAGGANPISLSTIDFSGGAIVRAGDGVNRSSITFDHNTTDRRVIINLSAGSFPPSGTATVQTTNPKRTFTITDRDTRDNTCACK